MKRSAPASSPDAYVTALSDWQRECVEELRGQRLREIEPRLRPGGKYEMATIELRRGASIAPATVRRLAAAAVRLNEELGDPTRLA